MQNLTSSAPITDVYDFYRDGKVETSDCNLVAQNSTNFLTALALITAPATPNGDVTGSLQSGGVLTADGPLTTDAPLTLPSDGATVDTNGYEVVLQGPLSGPGGLTKTGEGDLTLTAINSYAGGTTVSGGTLIATNPYALGNTSLTVGAGASSLFAPSLGGNPAAGPMIAGPADAAVAADAATIATDLAMSSLAVPAPTLAPPASSAAAQLAPAGIWEASARDLSAALSSTRRLAADLAWLDAASAASDASDLQHKKDVMVEALDAVFAQYD